VRRAPPSFSKKPAVVGHSFGGLLAQIIAGRGLSAATVSIDPAPFRGVLPLPISSLKSASPVLGNPANWNRAVTLSVEQFKYGWANGLSEDEAKQLHETFHVAAPGAPLFQAASANLNPWTEAKVNSKSSDRGRCWSYPARRITRCRGQSSTRRTRSSDGTPVSPRSRGS